MQYSDPSRRATYIPVALAGAALIVVSFGLFSESPPVLTTRSIPHAIDARPVVPVAASRQQSSTSLINELRQSRAEAREKCLAEIVQREDRSFIPELTRIHGESKALLAELRHKAEQLDCLADDAERQRDELNKSEQDAFSDALIKYLENRGQIEEHEANLELLTALRRLQGRPDPLRVFVTGFEPYHRVEWPDMPVLSVSLRNIDTLQEAVGFTFGGHARTGRPERFRCVVRNVNTGEVLPTLPPPSFIGGGLSHAGELKFSEGWHITLRLEDFVPQLDVGEYTLSVLYHNREEIADRESLDGLICSRSREYPFSVSKRIIEQSPEATASMVELLRTVDRATHIRIVEGRHGPWASEFIPADSPVGRVLIAGWGAVPALLNELDDESQSPANRAHTLALLFSITQQVDPRGERAFDTYLPQEKSAIGPFEYIRSGLGVSWHADGEGIGSSSSFSFASVERVGDSKLLHDFRLLTGTIDPAREMTVDPDLQAELVQQWKQLRERIEVRDPDSDNGGGSGGGGIF